MTTECEHKRRVGGLPLCMFCNAPLDAAPDRLRRIAADTRGLADYIDELAAQLEKPQPE